MLRTGRRGLFEFTLTAQRRGSTDALACGPCFQHEHSGWIVPARMRADRRKCNVHRYQADSRDRQCPAGAGGKRERACARYRLLSSRCCGTGGAASLPRVAACMVAALLFGLFAPARYTASMQVLIDPNDLRVVDNVLRGQNQLTETHVTQVENQVRVLLSNNVAKRVVERLSLDRDPDFIGSGFKLFDPRATIRALFGARPSGQQRSRARCAQRAQAADPRQARRSHLRRRRQRLGARSATGRSSSPMRCSNRSWRSNRPPAARPRAAPPAR